MGAKHVEWTLFFWLKYTNRFVRFHVPKNTDSFSWESRNFCLHWQLFPLSLKTSNTGLCCIPTCFTCSDPRHRSTGPRPGRQRWLGQVIKIFLSSWTWCKMQQKRILSLLLLCFPGLGIIFPACIQPTVAFRKSSAVWFYCLSNDHLSLLNILTREESYPERVTLEKSYKVGSLTKYATTTSLSSRKRNWRAPLAINGRTV